MELNLDICKQAWVSKDARFDGKFFIGVKTTGIYCRPICPVKSPQFKNVTFFKSAAQADLNGYRPCLRCRPESSPGTPVWQGTSTTVAHALNLISKSQLDKPQTSLIADKLGISNRHLNRLFMQHLGASPVAVMQTQRLHNAKRLLDETNLSMMQVCMAAGYQSLRRFNDHIKTTYGKSPSQLRKSKSTSKNTLDSSDIFCFKLPYRPPYDFQFILAFLSKRATPGVEIVKNNEYKRTIGTTDNPGEIRVSCDEKNHQLICKIQTNKPEQLFQVIETVKCLFDLGADPKIIVDHLKHDDVLYSLVKKKPGIRVPGSWNGFEIAVRAITGQQISVTGATTVMGKIVALYGENLNSQNEVNYLFPSAQSLTTLDPATLSMPKARALTIARVAQGVVDGNLSFLPGQDLTTMIELLLSIKGIGPWTAQYIAMRALAEPDALLEGDLVLEKKAAQLYQKGERMSTKELIHQAEKWRPWRAYAAMHIWNFES